MKVDPCKVCGGTDVNLVDGYYYCVECGTQDKNVRETIVEDILAAPDGTFVVTTKKRTRYVKEKIQMSGEWHKWHAYNFILNGLADELVGLGAEPTFKLKVLWIWTRYIKMYQNREEYTGLHKEKLQQSKIFQDDYDNENQALNGNRSNGDDSDGDNQTKNKRNKNRRGQYVHKDIRIVTKGVLLAIIYVALNLDKSDIQLSHLIQFINEDRLSYSDCLKFVPKEIDVQAIPHYTSFTHCSIDYNQETIRYIGMILFKKLELGVPLVPDMKKIISNYVKELCLPKDFKNLVFSLTHLVPYDFLQLDKTKNDLFYIPHFECVAMAYIVIALKICFGLDDEYEIKLSDAVDKINTENHNIHRYQDKSVKDLHNSDKLFSFRDWSNFLQLRKTTLCKYYAPAAHQHNINPDAYVFMEHLKQRDDTKVLLSDEITMNILNKIPLNNDFSVIPKSEFPTTLTPFTTYTDIILEYIQDPDTRLLLSEDFTKYSLKYAIDDIYLSPTLNRTENIIKGVHESNKIVNQNITGSLAIKKCDSTLVYVRNCENKNWLKTNPPTTNHIKNIKQDDNEKDRNADNDSYLESSVRANEINDTESYRDILEEGDKKLETVDEEDEDINIFDGLFDSTKTGNIVTEDHLQLNKTHSEYIVGDNTNDIQSEISDNAEHQFSPRTLSREEIIKQLIFSACKKYKTPLPNQYKQPSEPIKRKKQLVNNEAGHSEVKKFKVDNREKYGEVKRDVDKLIEAYNTILQNDIVNNISEHIKTIVQTSDTTVSLLRNNQPSMNFEDDDPSFRNIQSPVNDKDQNYDTGELNGTTQNLDNNANDTDEESTIEDLFTEGDPNFDEKIYDINQLYVKIKDQVDLESVFDIENDPEISEILEKQIHKYDEIIESTELFGSQTVRDDSSEIKMDRADVPDKEDDKSLDRIQHIKIRKKIKKQKRRLKPLIKALEINEFKYWVRHYDGKVLFRTKTMNKKFILELVENFPNSFRIVFCECASILNCVPYQLYQTLQNLEKTLIAKQHSKKSNAV